jgi:eukaryotic-like serine/threonine-protein kinase
VSVDREDRLDGAIVALLEAEDAGRPVDRAAWVATHPDLRDDLTRFLADRDTFDVGVAPLRAAATLSGWAVPPDPGLAPGRAVGDFELLEEVGRGGMGVVFRARDAVLGRVVALKMVRAGALATPDDLRRFQREARLVAGLDHPNIVPVYQTGTADGLGFIALRLVDGGSLAARRDEFRAPRRAAGLVATVARAVDYAHRHGVLHRDVKPGNILLDTGGVPYVTDFGLARPAGSADTTSPGAGTPAYMAPEQVIGDVTTAADTYALGAVLYDLLTGRPPFHGATPFGTVLDVLGREPVRPRRLAPGLPRDLEAVCLKCLEKEPARRYPSAAELADDLDRWLRGEPVRARPVSAVARLRRWARRHPLPAALAGALVVSILVGVGLVYREWSRAERHLAEARRQQQLAEEGHQDARQVLDEFCNRLIDGRLSRLPGTGPVRRDLLQAGLRYYEQFLRQREDDPEARRDVADAHFRLGALHAAIGEKPVARAEYRAALEMYAALEQSDPVRRMTAKAQTNLGNLLWDVGDVGGARANYRAAEVAWAAVLAEYPDSAEALGGRAKALNNLGQLLAQAGEFDAGGRAIAEGQALDRQRLDAGADDAESHSDLAAGLHAQANLLAGAGKHAEALEQLRQAADHLEAAGRVTPWDGGVKLDRAAVRRARAGSLWALGRKDEAEAEYKVCRSDLETLIAVNPEVGRYRAALADTLTNIGAVHAARKQGADARAAYQRAIELQDRLLIDDPDSLHLLQAQGVAAHNLGNLLRGEQRFAEAEARYRAAAEFFRRSLTLAPADPGTRYFRGGSLNNLADVQQKLGKPDEAIAAFTGAVTEFRTAHEAAPTRATYRDQLAATLGNLARALRKAGRTDAADAASRERDQLKAGPPR